MIFLINKKSVKTSIAVEKCIGETFFRSLVTTKVFILGNIFDLHNIFVL